MASVLNFAVRRFVAAGQGLRNAGTAAVSGHHEPGGYKVWKKLTFLVAMPAVTLCLVNAYLGHVEDHGKPRAEFVKYDYLRMRNKRFPWGDGTRTLFHNPEINALPDGYETEEAHH